MQSSACADGSVQHVELVTEREDLSLKCEARSKADQQGWYEHSIHDPEG